MRKWTDWLIQSHPASKWQSQDLNLGHSTPQTTEMLTGEGQPVQRWGGECLGVCVKCGEHYRVPGTWHTNCLSLLPSLRLLCAPSPTFSPHSSCRTILKSQLACWHHTSSADWGCKSVNVLASGDNCPKTSFLSFLFSWQLTTETCSPQSHGGGCGRGQFASDSQALEKVCGETLATPSLDFWPPCPEKSSKPQPG